MKKVVTVNLGGNAYQLEEDGFAVLSGYLDNARTRLHGNPDVDEILADLELAIADKAHRFLRANKTVVTLREVEQIAAEMGPVDASEDVAPTRSAPLGRTASAQLLPPEPDRGMARLYRLTGEDEKMLAGVCAGLAARSGIDVSIVRIAVVALTLATSGLATIGYFLLALIVPPARTPQQQAAAYGVPFDARGVLDQAKSKLKGSDVGREWRTQQRYWNRRARRAGFDGLGAFLGFAVVLTGVLLGLYLFSNVVSLFRPSFISVVAEPRFFAGAPWWLSLLILIPTLYVLAAIGGARRRDSGSAAGSFVGFTLKVAVAIGLFWFAFQTLPFVRDVVYGLLRVPYAFA